MSDSKSLLRQELRQRWKRISGDRQGFEKSIQQYSKQFLQSQSKSIWAIYRPHQDEINLDALWQDTQTGTTWVFPRLVDDSLVFLKARTSADFTQGRFGIWEPKSFQDLVAKSEIAGIFVPGLGFDWQGGRLGRGKGFYDRALSDYDGLKIGISPVQCVEERIPLEATDIKMDYLITEQGIWSCGDQKYC